MPQLDMRLFLAINFDDKTKKNIKNVQNQLKEQGPGHFSKEENFHLTLAFLGEKDEKELKKIKQVMETVPMPNLKLTFSRVNCFNKNDDETWWIGVEDNSELKRFQQRLTEALEREGLYKAEKKFLPHITLARGMKTGKLKLDIGKFTFETASYSLMKSERVNGALTYSNLYERKENVKSISFR